MILRTSNVVLTLVMWCFWTSFIYSENFNTGGGGINFKTLKDSATTAESFSVFTFPLRIPPRWRNSLVFFNFLHKICYYVSSSNFSITKYVLKSDFVFHKISEMIESESRGEIFRGGGNYTKRSTWFANGFLDRVSAAVFSDQPDFQLQVFHLHDPRDTIEYSGTRTNVQETQAVEIESTQPLRREENETAHDDYEFYRRYQLGSPKDRWKV